MIIMPDFKYVYVDIPKTGSMSLDSFFKSGFNGEDLVFHDPHQGERLYKHRRDLPKEYVDYGIIISVRNPFTRAVSFWQDCYRHKWEPFCETFDEFMDICLENLKREDDPVDHMLARLYPMHKYLDPIPRIDHIIHQETLDKDVKALPFVTGGIKVPKRNTNPASVKWEAIATPELREKVITWAGKDFEMFGYEVL